MVVLTSTRSLVPSNCNAPPQTCRRWVARSDCSSVFRRDCSRFHHWHWFRNSRSHLPVSNQSARRYRSRCSRGPDSRGRGRRSRSGPGVGAGVGSGRNPPLVREMAAILIPVAFGSTTLLTVFDESERDPVNKQIIIVTLVSRRGTMVMGQIIPTVSATGVMFQPPITAFQSVKESVLEVEVITIFHRKCPA